MKAFSLVCCVCMCYVSMGCVSAVFGAEPAKIEQSDTERSQAAYLDVHKSIDERVADLVSRLTLEEKATLLNHRGPTVERFHIRSDQWNQCLNGVKWDRPTTLFPICLAMSATWDTALVHEVANVLSDEARGIYNGWHIDPAARGEHKGLIYRAPVINIERNPFWGRNHEAWGEDPFLTGRMAVSYVKGLQGDDPHYLKIAATLKHYAVNNVETDRQKLNAVVSERMLRDYWLPHFHDAVVEGKAASLMASYNAINGVPNNINHWLLTDLLKDEWKHDGFVVSDLGGVRTMVEGHEAKQMSYEDAVAKSVMAGCDFSDKEFMENIPAAVRDGKLTEERLNDALTRVLRVRFRLGEFDPYDSVPFSRISPSVVDSAAHRAVALKAAQESIVLLQNRENLLPLDASKLKRIAVIGPVADRTMLNNYNGAPPLCVTALQGIKDRVGANVEVAYTMGGLVGGAPDARWKKESAEIAADPQAELARAVELARSSDVAIVCIGTTAAIEQEARDRKTLGLTGTQQALAEAVLAANPRTVVVQMSAGPLAVPKLVERAPAMLQSWWAGEEGGHALADVLFGMVNPAGRLPHTVYAADDQVPPMSEYDISKGFTYMYLRTPPLYPFGHGLSYTRFGYADLQFSKSELKAEDEVKISFTLTNTGGCAGDEVPQLYVHQVKSTLPRPIKELRGFQRVTLQPGESKTVSFTLPVEKLSHWDETTHAFKVDPGLFELYIGASSADVRLQKQIEVK